MKAVLLAAGKGSRLEPITNHIPKQMIKIASKPFLEYIIDDLVRCGFDEILIIIGHHGDQIKKYFQNVLKFNNKIQFVTQKEYKGTGDAIKYAKQFVGNNKFLVYLADTIIPYKLKDYLEELVADNDDISILSSVIQQSKISSVGNILLENEYVINISEKPLETKSNLAWAGLAFFKDGYIFEVLEDLAPSLSGEYDITEAMNLAILHNKKIKNHLCDKYIDSGTPNDLLETLKYILNKEQSHKNILNLKTTTVLSPTYIGKNCKFGKKVQIGPFVSMEDGVCIGDNVKIAEALILDDVQIPENKILSKIIISKYGDISCI